MVHRLSEAILFAGAALGALSTWLIGGIVTYDVVLRYLGMPTLWALEVSTYLMLGAATLGSGLAVLRGDHFAVDLLSQSLPARARQWLVLARNLACLGLTVFVACGFWQLMSLSLKLDMKSATLLRIPLVYPLSATFLAFALMALAFLYKSIYHKG